MEHHFDSYHIKKSFLHSQSIQAQQLGSLALHKILSKFVVHLESQHVSKEMKRSLLSFPKDPDQAILALEQHAQGDLRCLLEALTHYGKQTTPIVAEERYGLQLFYELIASHYCSRF